MSRDIEVYCYEERTYRGDIHAVLDPLKAAGHRVVVGHDADELSVLLEISRPTLLIYVLSSNGSRLSAAFQTLERRAIDLGLPIVLAGPERMLLPDDEVLFLFPEQEGFSELPVPLGQIAAQVERVRDERPSGFDVLRRGTPRGHRLGAEIGRPLRDGFGEDERLVIETAVADAEGDRLKVVTTVTDDDEVVVQEETLLDLGRDDITEKISSLHARSIDDYAPRRGLAGISAAVDARSSVSAPIRRPSEFPPRADAGWRNLIGRLTVILAMMVGIAAAAVALGVTLVVEERAPIPDVRPERSVGERTIPGLVVRLKRPPDEPAAEAPPENRGMRFPGSFAAGRAAFTIEDPAEEERFLRFVRGLRSASEVRVIGSATRGEIASGHRDLAARRAMTVRRYLELVGLPASGLRVEGIESPLGDDAQDSGGFVEVRAVTQPSPGAPR
jgi:hypothetical protein